MTGNDPVVPLPEVVGTPGPLNPQVLQFVFQAAQLSQAVKARKLEESKVPIGIKPLKVTVTTTTLEIRLQPPWISLSLRNDGSAAISVWVNENVEPSDLDTIASGEFYNLNMNYPVIETLYLKASSGTATVRIYGKQGRRQP